MSVSRRRHSSRRRTATMFGAGLAAVVLLGTSSPALAAGRYIGQSGSSRCPSATVCLFWGGDETGAYFSFTSTSVADIGNRRFADGTGSGAGELVINNAASTDCNRTSVNNCIFYVNQNFSGDSDFLYSTQVGNLFYTWNNEASYKSQ